MKRRENITLATGAVVAHRPMANGAQEAYVIGRKTGEMTPDEWTEYCALLASSKSVKAPRKKARR